MNAIVSEPALLPVFVATVMIIILLAVGMLAFIVANKQKQNRFYLESRQRDLDHQNQLLQTRLDVQEQSSRIIAQEIHDHINQTLGLIRLKVFIAAKRVSPSEQVLLREARELLEQTIRELRTISHSLNSEMVRQHGLKHAVQRHLEHLNEAEGLQAKVLTEGEANLSLEQEVVIFRIIQEAIKNAQRHAAAKNLTISLLYRKESFVLCCEDDGQGFRAHNYTPGMGMINMKERANLLGGILEVEAAEGKGTRIRLILELNRNATQTQDSHRR